MATYVLTIPDWLPASTNVLLRLHWAARNKRLKSDAEMVAGYALQASVPPAKGRRTVTLCFSAPGGRRAKTGDSDNRQKSALDACVSAGLLVDDSPRWCEVAVSCVKGPKQTTITLEDC